jgi:ABC-2 type transport system permease protein
VGRLINTELFKLRKRSLTWILLYVLIGIMIVLYLLLFAVSRITLPVPGPPGVGSIENLLGLPLALPFAFFVLSSFGAVLATILTASSVGSEYNWNTMKIALISSESRFKFLAAKLISALVLIFIGMLVGLATGFIMSLITTAVGGYSFSFAFATGDYLWDQFLQFWRTLYIILPYVLLGFLFSLIGRSAMAGIAVGIGVLFLEPIITALMRLAGGWVARIPDYLIEANVDAINSLNQLPGGFGSGPGGGFAQPPPVSQAFTFLTAYIAVFVILAFFIFRKRDVSG